MKAVELLADALSGSGPKRVTFSGCNEKAAAQTETDRVDMISDDHDLLGVVCHHRGQKMFVAWERIVMIESLPAVES